MPAGSISWSSIAGNLARAVIEYVNPSRLLASAPFNQGSINHFTTRKSNIRRQFQVLGDDAFGNVERPSDGFKAQVGTMPVSEYVSYCTWIVFPEA